jgi:predicted ATP-dependent serine protease
LPALFISFVIVQFHISAAKAGDPIMAKKKRKCVKYVTCRKCGYNKWVRRTRKKVGRCPSCGGYNRFEALPDRRYKKPKVGKPLIPYRAKRKRKRKHRHKVSAAVVEKVPEPSHEGAP